MLNVDQFEKELTLQVKKKLYFSFLWIRLVGHVVVASNLYQILLDGYLNKNMCT